MYLSLSRIRIFRASVQFNFTDYLRRVYLLGNVNLVHTDIVIVSELEVLRNVSMIIDQQSPRTVQNYLVWRFMMSQMDYMPKRFRLIKQQFNRVFQGVSAEKSRSITCAAYVTRNMGLPVAKLYIAKYFDEKARQQARKERIDRDFAVPVFIVARNNSQYSTCIH